MVLEAVACGAEKLPKSVPNGNSECIQCGFYHATIKGLNFTDMRVVQRECFECGLLVSSAVLKCRYMGMIVCT